MGQEWERDGMEGSAEVWPEIPLTGSFSVLVQFLAKE